MALGAAVTAGLVALATPTATSPHNISFGSHSSTISTIGSTVQANDDVNPYGIMVEQTATSWRRRDTAPNSPPRFSKAAADRLLMPRAGRHRG
jgi:hypothetical protein